MLATNAQLSALDKIGVLRKIPMRIPLKEDSYFKILKSYGYDRVGDWE